MVTKTKAWTEYLEGPQTEARYEIDIKDGKLVEARVIGYFTDEFGERHEFVRWDCSHGRFHKHCLYERKQRRLEVNQPLKTAFNEAKGEVRAEWRRYKKEFIRNHIQNG